MSSSTNEAIVLAGAILHLRDLGNSALARALLAEQRVANLLELARDVHYGPHGGEPGIQWINRIQAKAKVFVEADDAAHGI